MILIACVDDRGGVQFNGRRQSRDRLLLEDLIREAQGGVLWMAPYSALQFPEVCPRYQADPDFLDKAGPGEFCFVEGQPVRAYGESVESVILYRWNRVYPADRFWDLPLDGWKLIRRAEFPGSSHKLITKEVYIP